MNYLGKESQLTNWASSKRPHLSPASQQYLTNRLLSADAGVVILETNNIVFAQVLAILYFNQN